MVLKMKESCKVCGLVNAKLRHRESCFVGTKFAVVLREHGHLTLRLPRKIGRITEGLIDSKCKLYGPKGKSWVVRLLKVNNGPFALNPKKRVRAQNLKSMALGKEVISLSDSDCEEITLKKEPKQEPNCESIGKSPLLSLSKGKAVNISLLSESETDDSVNQMSTKSESSDDHTVPELNDDHVVPEVNGNCPRKILFHQRNYSVRLLNCIVRTENEGDNGSPFVLTGLTRLRVLYQLVGHTFNYEIDQICLHHKCGSVDMEKTADELNIEDGDIIYVHPKTPSMNVDSRYYIFNFKSVANYSFDVKLLISRDKTVEELYEAWAKKACIAEGTFILACHGSELPPDDGLLVDAQLQNEDYIFCIKKRLR